MRFAIGFVSGAVIGSAFALTFGQEVARSLGYGNLDGGAGMFIYLALLPGSMFTGAIVGAAIGVATFWIKPAKKE